MAGYWKEREGLDYYRIATDYVRKHAPPQCRLLDVGGGVGGGCRYLDAFPDYQRTVVELPCGPGTLEGVRVIHADFLEWEPDGTYDVVMCLQVLEHIPDAAAFARKLFACAPVAVISVPYRWRAGHCKHHVHDPVDEIKLYEWTQRQPSDCIVVGQTEERLVAVYEPAGTAAFESHGGVPMVPRRHRRDTAAKLASLLRALARSARTTRGRTR
ncbi:MAG: class I SAM-dependent methyltransferase [Longimicrobiales bacterium]